MKNILQISPYYPPAKGFGGPPEVAHNLSKALVNRGHSVEVISTNICKQEGQIEAGERIIDNIPTTFWKIRTPKYWKNCYYDKVVLQKKIHDSDLVLIHTIYPFLTYMALKECTRQNKKFLLFAHGMLDKNALRKNSFLKNVYLKLFIKKFLRPESIVFNAEEELENSVFNNYGTVIYNGVELRQFDDAPIDVLAGRCQKAKNKTTYLFLGRLDPKKGLDILIKGFSRFSNVHSDVHLIIAGNGSLEQTKSIKDEIDRLGSAEHISLIGPIYGKEKFALLKQVDCFVQPSYYEGLSISLLEAMAAKRLIITSNKVGIWKTLKQKNAAIIINPLEEEFFHALMQTKKDKFPLSGENAYLLITEKYNWNKIAKTIENKL